MASPIATESLEEADSTELREMRIGGIVPDPADNDGHFPGIEDKDVKNTIRDLNNVKTRRYAYIMFAALPARFVKEPKAKKDPHAPLDRRLTDAELRVLLTLVRYASHDLNSSFPGLPTLAKQYGWSLKVLRRLVKSLVTKGWITRSARSGLKTAVNRFCVPPGVLATWDADGWKCPPRATRASR